MKTRSASSWRHDTANAGASGRPSRRVVERERMSIRTLYELLKHFSHRQRFVLVPLLLVLLLAAVLLVFTSGLSYVAPFVYTLF